MRFEIGPGGMLVVLLGLLGLSGAVFGLGLIAGHELAGPEPGAPPVAAAYPVPTAPAGSDEPAASTASAPAPSVANSTASATTPPDEGANSASVPTAVKIPDVSAAKPARVPVSVSTHKHVPAEVASKTTHKAASSDEDDDLAPGSAVAPPSASSSGPAETADTSANDETEDDSAPPAPAAPVHKRLASLNPSSSASSAGHPYSIQIDAMMDYHGAQQMEQKLRAKGFQPYMVPTQLGGKTWYRLRVGHYATPADAQAAENKLHQEFNDTPSAH
jgi:septal ring-binding cell division protein DamX